MGKKSGAASAKAASKAAKKAKSAQKNDKRTEKKAKGKDKASGKGKRDDDSSEDEQDLDAILDQIKREWEAAHTVSETLATGPPSRRANATLTPCPSGNYIWMIGGEYFSEDNKAYFYADVYRYTPDKDEWRLFTSPTRPNPRSAHAVAASPKGLLFLFGGEFSSLHQTTFHHYRDLWSFDISTHMWERIETKVRPNARSGHRMAFWKHLLVLFGGFNDPGGPKTNYYSDTWVFDTLEYKWTQVCNGPTQQSPPARSGFSFLPTPDGIVLHGGYCKNYTKGKKVQGTALDDTWFLKMDTDFKLLKWSRMKPKGKAPHPPSRSGCTAAVWGVSGKAVLFGGVTDVLEDEENIDSVFYQDVWALHLTAPGRWQSMALRKPKKKAERRQVQGKQRRSRRFALELQEQDEDNYDENSDIDSDDSEDRRIVPKTSTASVLAVPELDADDPQLTIPLQRYNAMLAIVRNTLYIYGGIVERGAREYTLDDFYSLNLDKLERFECLRPCDVVFGVGEESSDESEGGSDEEEDEDRDEEDEENPVPDAEVAEVADDLEENAAPLDDTADKQDDTPAEKSAIRSQAEAFMGVSRDATRSAEDALSTPLPGETLAAFYARSRTYWSERAFTSGASDQRGKMLRRDGFTLAQERYTEYKPLLKEVEKILKEAGLDDDEMKRGAAAGGPSSSTLNRNRR
ncbi:galactose oxidase [Auriculariales sp. MPI-PUGE-AT-0066]|nr:galactose oxidase [Auriculariales sp. MPI-PUGE-AT-0066]